MKQSSAKRKDFEAQASPELESLYRTALYLLEDEPDAQDLVLETFAGGYRLWLNNQLSPSCRVCLFRIMANILINQYRPFSSLSTGIGNADEIDISLVHSQLVDQQSMNDSSQVPFSAISEPDIRAAIRELPEDLRLIAVLSSLEGFSYREISDITGIHLGAVRARLHQVRQLIRESLSTMWPGKTAAG